MERKIYDRIFLPFHFAIFYDSLSVIRVSSKIAAAMKQAL
jgi:hypothetical protein